MKLRPRDRLAGEESKNRAKQEPVQAQRNLNSEQREVKKLESQTNDDLKMRKELY